MITITVINIDSRTEDIEMAIKHSKQRDSIRAFLDGRIDHPTAEEVYINIKKDFPNISLATVYRNLSLLADMGEINRITTPDRVDHFDYNTKPHNHFICSRCRRVMDIWMEDIGYIDELAEKNFDGRIEGHSLIFNGTCKSCLAT